MPDHKFEPGQLVLVRDEDSEAWELMHFSFFDEENCYPFRAIGDFGFKQCIPFNAETKQLQNTAQPYEPPKPPQVYEWGQKVEVYTDGRWEKAIFNYACEIDGVCVMPKTSVGLRWVKPDRIRPLPDSSAQ